MIAGASGGIGRFLSKKFEDPSNELILTYNKSKYEIDKLNLHNIKKFKCDFTKKEEVMSLYSKIDSLEVLINVMGHVDNSLVCNMNEKEWDKVIESNLKTVFLSCRYALEKINKNGHIINISSVLGSTGMIGASNYCAAKGGVESFTKSLALECLHKRRIFVNAIALGYFNIGMGLKLSEKIVKIVKDEIPIKEFGNPEEIYNVIKYIISSRYLVGQIIHLNGGLYI